MVLVVVGGVLIRRVLGTALPKFLRFLDAAASSPFKHGAPQQSVATNTSRHIALGARDADTTW